MRGTTSKRIVKMLREAGAKEIYFISASPPLKHPCIYGIDMSISTELIAANKTVEYIKKYIKADALIYQDLEDLREIFQDQNMCTACLSGEYPTEDAFIALKLIEAERYASKK